MEKRAKCKLVLNILTYITILNIFSVTKLCDAASVRTAKPPKQDVFVVTPVPGSSEEARDFPSFLPTSKPPDNINKNPLKLSRQNSTRKISISDTPDIIMAEFPKPSNGSKNQRMLSVQEMLNKEKVATYLPKAEKQLTSDETNEKSNMKVEDVWDIIRHNQNLEKNSQIVTKRPVSKTPTIEYKNRNVQTKTPIYERRGSQNENVEDKESAYSIETIHSISADQNSWSDIAPTVETAVVNESTLKPKELVPGPLPEEPRNIRGGAWGSANNHQSNNQRYSYYPAYHGGSSFYSTVDDDKYDRQPATGEAQDRYNPAQPYLPPAVSPNRPKPMPPPPVPMPPPPPPPKPQSVINPPPMTYDSFPSFPPSSDSKPPDSSGPSGIYSYPPPSGDSGPPTGDSGPPTGDSGPPPSDDSGPPPDDHHHHHHHDTDFKFEAPPSDPLPELIFDDHHHHSHEIEYDYHDFHHHHHHPPPPPPTTTTTTAAPEPEQRVTNRFSYYYLGKKLWYLPLYFSVYFIIYVGALIIKSIARHKITYPQHFKTKRSLDWNISSENLNYLTRITSNALMRVGEKYFTKSS